MLDPKALKFLRNNLHKLTLQQKEEVLALLAELESRDRVKKAKTSLLGFVTFIEPDYKIGAHHRRLASLLENLANGEKDRVAVNIAPRFGKSHLVSYYFPAWFLGNHPDQKVMMVSHTADLAVDFGRKVRNLIASERYQAIFGGKDGVELSQDSKSAGRWHTNHGGEYFAVGVGGAIAGRGADLLLIDDPHNEQDIINGNLDVFDKAYEWFTTGARTRLMPGGRVAIVQTRWALNDLTGRVVKDMVMNDRADQYEVVEFPAVMEVEEEVEVEDPENPGSTVKTVQIVQKSLWPEQWPLEALLRTKESMPAYQWSAQYQQNPTSEEGAIVKREWWREWREEQPPRCDFIIQSWDTAFEKTTRSDFSACTTWGVWWPEREPNEPTTGSANIILLDSFKDRMEFPELKQVALQHYRTWEETGIPVSLIVEKKASGAPLIYELRAMGIPAQEYTPSKGHDKISRLNSVADLFKSGMVWAPQTRWAEELADEIAAFPAGEHDDLVDATSLALMRFRQGGFVRLPSDEPDPIRYFKSRRSAGYY
jgi:predicted phage terminase large subunit-like protein